MACIDSGVDYAHPDFRKEDGTTRILALWDQTIQGKPPEGYLIGAEYGETQINQALQAGEKEEREQLVPSRDLSGHGTAVLGIAAGNGRASGGRYRGVAYESSLLVVKLGKLQAGRISPDNGIDTGSGLCGEKKYGAVHAAGLKSEFWK